MNTTLAQIAVAAQTAANKAYNTTTPAGTAPDALAIETTKLEEFGASGFDRADFQTFEQQFQMQLQMLQNWSKQPSPATLAAQKAAQTAAQPKT